MPYKEADANAFKQALEAEGFKVEHYRGRGFFEGPAVTVEDRLGLIRAIRATPEALAESLQWDTLGKAGYVVYGPAGKNTDDD